MKFPINLDRGRNGAQLRAVAPALFFALFVLLGSGAVVMWAPDHLILGSALAAGVLAVALTALTYWLRRREAGHGR